MTPLILLLIIVGVSRVQSLADFRDACYLTTHIGVPDDEQIDLSIPQKCTYGTVDWHYPKQTLDLHLTRADGRRYSLCLEESWGTYLGGLKKVSNGVQTEIPLPIQGTPACTDDVDGKTEFLISPRDILYYMTTFNYRVNQHAVQ